MKFKVEVYERSIEKKQEKEDTEVSLFRKIASIFLKQSRPQEKKEEKEIVCYGFRILNEEGVIIVDQDVKPHAEGFQPMTKEEAEKFGEQLRRYYETVTEVET